MERRWLEADHWSRCVKVPSHSQTVHGCRQFPEGVRGLGGRYASDRTARPLLHRLIRWEVRFGPAHKVTEPTTFTNPCNILRIHTVSHSNIPCYIRTVPRGHLRPLRHLLRLRLPHQPDCSCFLAGLERSTRELVRKPLCLHSYRRHSRYSVRFAKEQRRLTAATPSP